MKSTDHVIILKLAGCPDRVEYSVVDDGVHGEGDAVRGEDLLGRNLKHSSSGVDTTNLNKESINQSKLQL